MSLYFICLPIELRIDLLKRLPPSHLLEESSDLTFLNRICNMFSLTCFKMCDTNEFWRAYYKQRYIVDTIYNIKKPRINDDFRALFRKAYTDYKHLSVEKLKYAMKNGHNWMLWEETRHDKYVWLDFDKLFIEAVHNLQWDCLYDLDLAYDFNMSTYQHALNILALKKLDNYRSEPLDQWIDLLLEYGTTFPQIKVSRSSDYYHGTIYFANQSISHRVFDDTNNVDFFRKYNAVIEPKKLLQHLIPMGSAIVVITYLLDKFNVVIDDEIVKSAIENEDIDMMKLFVERGYKPTADILYFSSKTKREIFDYILEIYNKK